MKLKAEEPKVHEFIDLTATPSFVRAREDDRTFALDSTSKQDQQLGDLKELDIHLQPNSLNDSLSKPLRPLFPSLRQSRRERRLTKKAKKLQNPLFTPGQSQYILKQGSFGKLFLKDNLDPVLLHIFDEFKYFEPRLELAKTLQRNRLRQKYLWGELLENGKLPLERLIGFSTVENKLKNFDSIFTEKQDPASATTDSGKKTTPDSSIFSRTLNSSTQYTVTSSTKSKYISNESEELVNAKVRRSLCKKRSGIFESSIERPKRKCISFHIEVDSKASEKELLLKCFKILRWRKMPDGTEDLVVIFNECVTLNIRLATDKDHRWNIQKIDYKIFSADNNFHSLLSSCIDYVTFNYSQIDLFTFLGLLYVIQNDVFAFYKKCKVRFERIKSDRLLAGVLRIQAGFHKDILVNVFTNEIKVECRATTNFNLTTRRRQFSLGDKLGVITSLRDSGSTQSQTNSSHIPFESHYIDLVAKLVNFHQKQWAEEIPKNSLPSIDTNSDESGGTSSSGFLSKLPTHISYPNLPKS